MRVILWFSLILAVAGYILGPLVDPDLWWHITIGKWVLAHRELPKVDHWNMFSNGEVWRAYSWLFEVLVAKVEQLFSLSGLIVLQYLLAVLLCAGLCFIYAKLLSDSAQAKVLWVRGMIFGIFVFCSCYNHFTLRPQSIIWLLFALVLFFADQISRQGLKVPALVGTFFCFVLWANVHLSAALGLLALISWIGIKREAIVLALVGFLGTLCTPYFGGEWLTFLSKTGHPFSHQAIAEFQPATVLQPATAFLVITLFMVLVLIVNGRGRSVPLCRYLAAGVFTLGALAVIKFLPFAVIFLTGLAASLIRDSSNGSTLELEIALDKLEQLLSSVPREGLAFVALAFALVRVWPVLHSPLDEQLVPRHALDLILEQKLPLPLLHGFGDGGYVMYRFSQSDGTAGYKVPIDGRTNVVPPHVWDKYLAALKGGLKWRGYVELVQPNTVLWRLESPLVSLLLESGDWCNVFQQGTEKRGYIVLVKKSLGSTSNCRQEA